LQALAAIKATVIKLCNWEHNSMEH